MKQPLSILKDKDWSLNLEDAYYAERPDELVRESVEAVAMTAPGRYINLVTPPEAGHPEQGLIGRIETALKTSGTLYERIVYIDECGCGGFVTRVYR